MSLEAPGSIVRRLAVSRAECTEPIGKLFIVRDLASAFQASGRSAFASEELAEEWASRYEATLLEQLREIWESEGVNPPLEKAAAPGLYIGPGHPTYAGDFTENCFAILRRLVSCDDRELNCVAACVLAALGANRIFVVDGPSDAGVDVIGCWSEGPLLGFCGFVQSKAWKGRLGAQDVEDIIIKLDSGANKDIWRAYISYVGGSELPGIGRMFVVFSRDGFSSSGLSAARKLGALCWGPRRAALLLGSRYEESHLRRVIDALMEMPRDPERNLYSIISNAEVGD